MTILNRLEERLAELARSPEQIAAQTNELCLQRGRLLEVVQGTTTIRGHCAGIAADGALLLGIDGQTQSVYSGIVISD
jgi:biotin-(acetyl-CoA carboxylase) ligase